MLEESWDFLSSHPAVCSLCRPQSKDARRTLLLRYTFIQTRRWKANGACWVQQKTECHHTFVELRRGSAVVFCALATVAGGYDGDILVKREWKWSIVVEGMRVLESREKRGAAERDGAWAAQLRSRVPGPGEPSVEDVSGGKWKLEEFVFEQNHLPPGLPKRNLWDR